MRIDCTKREIERFETYVDRSGGPDACHLWTGCINAHGYGNFRIGGSTGSTQLCHRIAWAIAGHEITEDKPLVLHDCPGGDNPACVNPRHLWAGTQAENVRDMARKGRGRRGKKRLPFGAMRQRNGRYQAGVRIDGKFLRLGTYDTADEASAVALARKQESLRTEVKESTGG